MSESLNRAFLKAYDKDKVSEAKRIVLATEQAAQLAAQQVEDLIMRFDTATVPIPSPHVFDKRMDAASPHAGDTTTTRPSTATAAPQPQQAKLPSQSEHTPKPHLTDSQALQAAEAELRQKIALQMTQAGEWHEHPIDAFIGGFPMISQLHASEVRSAPTPPKLVEIAHPAPQSSVAASLLPRTPEPVATEQRYPPAAVNEPLKLPTSGRSQTGQPAPAQPARPLPGVPLEPLVAPQGPALTSPAPTPQAQAQPQTLQPANAGPQGVEAAVAQRMADGDIFRLDRPSYTSSTQPEPIGQVGQGNVYADNASQDDDSSILGEQSDSVTNIDINPVEGETAQGGSTRSASRAKSKSTQQVEHELRQARARVFNPVWEVDSFQWPAVCLELLDKLDDKLNRVANNLAAACQEGLQILAVTSPQRGEGSSTVACCLALLAGNHGLKVAIVDGAIEHPSLSYQTNLDVEQDWRVAILNHMPLEEVAVHSIEDQVTLVPLLGPISHNELADDDDRIAHMLQELADSFDLVIVDTGTMATTRNLVTSMGRQGVISAAVAVVDYRSSTAQCVEDCLRKMRQAGIASIGLVENFAA